MITITRRQARRLRAVFRRHPLGITHKGLVPPLVFSVDPVAGLRVRHHQAPLAVECILPGDDRSEEVIAVPLDALADFEGKDDSPVILEAAAPGRSRVRWEDRGIPQSKEYQASDPDGLPSFPGFPTVFETCTAELLDALAEAALTTEEGSTRYALDCLQLKGATGEVVATDGRQILIQGGFRFPWDGDLLVRRTPLFASRALPRDRPVGVGRTDAHVAVRAGDWTAWLTVRTDARFPRIEHAISDAAATATRLRLDPEDAAFLAQALDRLPGADVLNSPVTFDLNGCVAVRARGVDQTQATELILASSNYSGAPVRVNANRVFLARAIRLGFTEVEFVDADSPVTLRDRHRTYCFQPLSKESAIEPSDDATRIEAPSPGSRPTPKSVASLNGELPMHDKTTPVEPPSKSDATSNGQATTGESAGGLAALIQEAEALHEALSDARARTGRLTVALRRYRRRERLVSNTLASLKALKLQDVAG